MGKVQPMMVKYGLQKKKKSMFLRNTESMKFQRNETTDHVNFENNRLWNHTWMVKNLPAMQETWVSSLGLEDPLE